MLYYSTRVFLMRIWTVTPVLVLSYLINVVGDSLDLDVGLQNREP